MDLLDVYGMCSPRFFLSQEQEELLGKEKKLLFKLSSQPSYNAVRSLFFSLFLCVPRIKLAPLHSVVIHGKEKKKSNK